MPVVDLSFRIQGKTIPADHGYALYAAVSRIVAWVHQPEQKDLGIHPINGLLAGSRMLQITPRSRLLFRLNSDHIKELLPLAGKELNLDGYKLRVGVPTVYALKPRATLRSRLVTIKHRMEPEKFLEGVQAELAKLNIRGKPCLIPRRAKADRLPRDPFIRRTVRIRDKEIVGYAVMVRELNADESLRLQETGIGGRRRFGCGIFTPTRA